MADATNYAAAAEAVQSFAEQFKSIIVLSDALRGLGSVDLAISERKKGLVQAAAAHQEMLGKLDLITAQVADVEKRLAQELEDHKKAVEAVSVKAEADAKDKFLSKMAEATARTAELVNIANKEAARIELASQTASAAVESRLGKARDETKSLEDGLPALRSEFADLDRKIGDLRKIAQSITG